jgi:cbb3-type cytochrome oxidase cytochrome c subunit
MVVIKEARYCGSCGSQMVRSLIPAEKNIHQYESISLPYESAYNKENGKRQYCPRFTCPNRSKNFFKRLFDSHAEEIVDEIFFK